MNLLIIKTDIDTAHKKQVLSNVLKEEKIIQQWTVDLTDRDHILKARVNSTFTELNLIEILRGLGLVGQIMED